MRPTVLTLFQAVLISSAGLSADAFCPPPAHQWQTRLPSTQLRVSTSTSSAKTSTKRKRTITGPPIETKPDYSSIHGPIGPFVDIILMSLFRVKLAERLNNINNEIRTQDSKLPLNDFMGIVELTSSMNAEYNNRTEVQELAREVLVSLFPTFILDRYPSWFAQPFPIFSAKMCAWATMVGGTWLMGECHVNDVPELENGGKAQGVLVKRCRFLEESQCASICVNSCKIPTQNFFRQNMGLALTMTPDYETGECQFAYGKLPTEEEEREARETPCLQRCPSGGGMRSWHDNNNGELGNRSGTNEQWLQDLEDLGKLNTEERATSTCMLMED